jgi:hypothetical protein
MRLIYVAQRLASHLGSFENATIPAILWLRTARELVPVQHCSKKTWGKFCEFARVAGNIVSSRRLRRRTCRRLLRRDPDDNVKEPSAVEAAYRCRHGAFVTGRKGYQLLNLESVSTCSIPMPNVFTAAHRNR